jgi:hypothetical protein
VSEAYPALADGGEGICFPVAEVLFLGISNIHEEIIALFDHCNFVGHAFFKESGSQIIRLKVRVRYALD